MLESMNVYTAFFIFIISLLIAIGFHEAMHAFVGHRLGDTTARDEGRLTLNPFAHIDFLTTVLLPSVLVLLSLPPIFIAKPVPLDPYRIKYEEYGVAIVALAGPLTNLALAFITGVVLKATASVGFGLYYDILTTFVAVNVGLFVFNMLPIPPLDGSRLLYAFAPDPLRRVMATIESFGLFAILAIFILLLPVIGPSLASIRESISLFILRL